MDNIYLEKQRQQKINEERAYKEFNQTTISEAEHRVLKLLSLGKTQRQIARKLNISRLTVPTHLSRIYKKIGVRNATQAVRYYIFAEYGMIDFEADNTFLDHL